MNFSLNRSIRLSSYLWRNWFVILIKILFPTNDLQMIALSPEKSKNLTWYKKSKEHCASKQTAKYFDVCEIYYTSAWWKIFKWTWLKYFSDLMLSERSVIEGYFKNPLFFSSIYVKNCSVRISYTYSEDMGAKRSSANNFFNHCLVFA